MAESRIRLKLLLWCLVFTIVAPIAYVGWMMLIVCASEAGLLPANNSPWAVHAVQAPFWWYYNAATGTTIGRILEHLISWSHNIGYYITH